MGGGNDSVDFANTFTGTDVYDGGDGTDTLIVEPMVSQMQVLRLQYLLV